MMKCPHCDTHIDKHEATRCLNAWMAEAVMGGIETMNFQEKSECYWRFETPEGKSMLVNSKVFQGSILWSPCTSIADAWEVIEKLQQTVNEIMLDDDGDWRCYFNEVCAYAPTAPLAICQAAIKAMHE